MQLIGLPLILLYFVIRCITDREYRAGFAERLGHLPQAFERTPANSIWLHAVSVGEVISAVPLIRVFREERPNVPIYVSTSTVAGRRAAKQRLSGLVDGVFYAPIDYGMNVRRVLLAIRPALLIVLETEIWPNLYRESKRAGAGLVLVNARISSRTWPTYKKLRWFFRPLLRLADGVFAQTSADADRYRELGVGPRRIHLEGNLKYDAAVAVQAAAELDVFGAEHVWIAASTVGPNERGSVRKHSVDEDDVVLAGFRELSAKFPSLLLVLAPRQPARFDVVAEKLRSQGISFVRRSQRPRHLNLPGVLLLDSIGELASWYAVGDVAFVGGSLAPRGGHNIVEASSAGVPVVTGPHMQNFEAMTFDLRECGALQQIGDGSELAGAVEALLRDRDRARRMAEAGRACVRAKAGAAKRIASSVWRVYDGSFPTVPRSEVSRVLYGRLAWAWTRGAARRRERGQRQSANRPAVPVPVVSIGGISVGGSGKTPLANQVAAKLRGDGWNPGILTRGYRRRSTAETILLGAGTLLPATYTGDEAHIFLRAGHAAVGIGANRHATAEMLLERFPGTNVLVLDDGFQHARMRRDADILVIDGLDPWGGGAAVPLGRLREPLEVLRRASMLVVTRAEDANRFAVIRERLREIAGDVPVFRSTTRPVRWRDATTLKPIEIGPAEKAGAFCGLGNPANFWKSLEKMGLNPVFRWEFPDHHHYRLIETAALVKAAEAHGARWLLTTEKDCNNLPSGQRVVPMSVRMAWLEIELVIEDQERFYAELARCLRSPMPRLG